MAIAESHLSGSCKAVPGRCYNRNRSHTPASPSSLLLLLSLSLLLVTLTALPTLCSALTSESTTLPSVDTEEVTTLNPPQQPVNEPHVEPTVAAVNETNVRLEPEPESEPESEPEPEETAAAEVADEFAHTSFVALGGEGLEQGIRNAVKSEVESEIEADASGLVETLQVDHKEDEHKTTSNNEEQTDAAQGVREPKTLATNVEKVEASDKVEEKEKAVELAEVKKVESTEIDSESDNTQESVEAKEPAIAERSDALVDSSPAEINPVEAESRPLPSVTSDLVAVIFDENRAITEQPITKTNLLALEREHEEFREVETTPQPAFEVPKHQVTKKQGVEDLLPKENAEKLDEPQSPPEGEENARDERNLETAAESTSEGGSAQDQLNEVEKKDLDVEPAATSTAEPDYVAPTEATPEQAVVTLPEETLTLAEGEQDQSEAEEKPDLKESSGGESSSASSTASPTRSETDKADESVEDDSRDESDAEKETEQGAVEPADKDSSEESEELAADEPKARAEDSTATPLVSYPPHNAGQTFVSNLADERSAHLSLASSSRSTLIIALCSGTAVLFIVVSLVIFVLSFQRQHGTLDIEMQEQRLGKDDLDQEDAQMKLLDVELSPPVIIAMGNEETDECL